MSYVSVDELKAYVRNEITGDDEEFQQALESADAMINARCARTFTVAGEEATARTFVPDTFSGVLRLPDFTELTALTENGSALTVTTDYQLEPVNTTTWAGEVWPYQQVRRQGNGYWYTYNGTGTVVVTATWGWPAVPAAVKTAEKILAKDILLHRDVKFGLVGVSDYGGVRAREASLVEQMLTPYMRVESYGIA